MGSTRPDPDTHQDLDLDLLEDHDVDLDLLEDAHVHQPAYKPVALKHRLVLGLDFNFACRQASTHLLGTAFVTLFSFEQDHSFTS